MEDNQRCIRVFADENQIEDGKKALAGIDRSLNQTASVLQLAGNETRLKILYLLYREHQLCVCDLGDILEMKTPAISQHLRKLKDGGLIKPDKKGQTIFYKIREEALRTLKPLFEQFRSEQVEGDKLV